MPILIDISVLPYLSLRLVQDWLALIGGHTFSGDGSIVLWFLLLLCVLRLILYPCSSIPTIINLAVLIK
jgi:hypothetical protein